MYFETAMLLKASNQMVMHVCSRLMRFAELSKWILLSSKKLGEDGSFCFALGSLAYLNPIDRCQSNVSMGTTSLCRPSPGASPSFVIIVAGGEERRIKSMKTLPVPRNLGAGNDTRKSYRKQGHKSQRLEPLTF